MEDAWPSAGRMPAPLGRWVAALGALCYAPLGSRGPLAGARVAPLGWHVGGPDVVLPTNRARGTDGLCALGY